MDASAVAELATAGDAFTLEELTELALGADLDPTVDPDAQPFVLSASATSEALLPRWYMPAVSVRSAPGWRRWLVVGLVVVLVGIEVSGLCSAFGQLVVG